MQRCSAGFLRIACRSRALTLPLAWLWPGSASRSCRSKWRRRMRAPVAWHSCRSPNPGLSGASCLSVDRHRCSRRRRGCWRRAFIGWQADAARVHRRALETLALRHEPSCVQSSEQPHRGASRRLRHDLPAHENSSAENAAAIRRHGLSIGTSDATKRPLVNACLWPIAGANDRQLRSSQSEIAASPHRLRRCADGCGSGLWSW